MLNRYPLWKYLLLIVVLIVSFLYSLPNMYGEDPAVQVLATRGEKTGIEVQDTIKTLLEKNSIKAKSILFENNSVLVRLPDTDSQLKVKEILMDELGNNFNVALNLAPSTPKWLSYLGAAPMKLGLDLRGGVHFLMEVDMTTVMDKLLEQVVDGLQSEFKEKSILLLSINKTGDHDLQAIFENEQAKNKAITYLNSYRNDIIVMGNESNRLILQMSDERIKQAKRNAVEQNIAILRNRVNQLGVAEPLVQRQGMERIIIELPGIQDTALAKEILGATATLEFRLVNDDPNLDYLSIINNEIKPPYSSELKSKRNGDPVILYKRVVLTGDHIIGATSEINQYGNPQVNISLDSAGGTRMFNVTKNNLQKNMATLFVEYRDNGKRDEKGKAILEKHEEVINVATIQGEFGSRFQITGIDSITEARQLSLLLRAGALIAPVQIVEERTVGPSLGLQNIEKGLQSCLWGMAITVLFMLVVYKLFGVFASLALLFNLLLIIGIMSLLPGATLTMPGIAGIVLTVGMAVDANVLINERIKEELNNGRSVQKAIDEGYKGAWNSIFDANITTLITAAILYAVGVGSIKGFAITLAIGILTSMFTAIVGTRALVNLIYGNKRHVKKLSI